MLFFALFGSFIFYFFSFVDLAFNSFIFYFIRFSGCTSVLSALLKLFGNLFLLISLLDIKYISFNMTQNKNFFSALMLLLLYYPSNLDFNKKKIFSKNFFENKLSEFTLNKKLKIFLNICLLFGYNKFIICI